MNLYKVLFDLQPSWRSQTIHRCAARDMDDSRQLQ